MRNGIPASPGIVIGPAYVARWEQPRAPQTALPVDMVEAEVERFAEARTWTHARLRELKAETADRLGTIEAQIFEPQIMMLDDADLVDGTIRFIRENHLPAARAFELQMLEFQSAWRRTGHPMVMDRLNDLLDLEARVLRRLLGQPDPELVPRTGGGRVILVARDLTPTATVQLDPDVVLGLALDGGTRTSHSAILARAMKLPAVVNLGDLSKVVATGDELILDGRSGHVLVRPTQQERSVYRDRDVTVREWEQELLLLSHLEAVTTDGSRTVLRANIDLPAESEAARSHGAQGIGLFRTEFLVVGRSAVPEEEEQFRAYKQVAERFQDQPVLIRTFDLGGDKFPLFLKMPPEENPFLGWRAIRLCLDEPELFRPHLRALLRATAVGDVRIMLPLINELDEVHQTRTMLEEEAEGLKRSGIPYDAEYRLGVMIETPAAALIARQLATVADFFSIGTNDLVQYTLAVDRGNAALAPRFSPFHPAVLKLMHKTAKAGRDAGIEVSVCGELAAHPLGLFMLLGLGIDVFSVGPASLTEIKKVIRSVNAADARRATGQALDAATSEEVIRVLTEGLSRSIDLALFSGRWNLSSPE